MIFLQNVYSSYFITHCLIISIKYSFNIKMSKKPRIKRKTPLSLIIWAPTVVPALKYSEEAKIRFSKHKNTHNEF